MTRATIAQALDAFRLGKPLIVVDDHDRENEGDLIYPAQTITKEDIAFMLAHTSGIICVPCTQDRLQKFNIPLMVKNNQSRFGCAFTVSVDAKAVSTGVSAADRLLTIQTLVDSSANPSDLVQPGHIFPLRAVPGGVLQRVGHTEAAVDLCALAGFQRIGVLAELMHKDGTMMRLDALEQFSKEHNIPLISIADLVSYRRKNETLIEKHNAVHFPTEFGDFTLIPYGDIASGGMHFAIVKGDVSLQKNVLVRVHSACFTGDVFGSQRCDCGKQLHAALKQISDAGCGVLLYMNQEGRGIGLANKLRAYHLQEKGFDTVEANEMLGFGADLRDYGVGAQILKDLGLSTLRLLTNNPRKIVGLEAYGLSIVDRVPLIFTPTKDNFAYLHTKKEKLGHLLDGI